MIASNCENTAIVTLDPIIDQNHMITDAAYTLPLAFTVTPVECTIEVTLSETISPASISTPINSLANTIQIPLVNDLADAQTYSISVAAKIGTTELSTKGFMLKVYDCSSLKIDPAKFTNPTTPYAVGSTQQNIDWSNSDLTVYEPLCGPVDWTVTDASDNPPDASIYTT